MCRGPLCMAAIRGCTLGLWERYASCHVCVWVISHRCMSHVTYMYVSWNMHGGNKGLHRWSVGEVWVTSRICMYHVIYMYESCHVYVWVMSYVCISHVIHMYESWVMSHTCMSRDTYIYVSCHMYVRVMSLVCTSHEPCRTYIWVMSHVTYMCAALHICMSQMQWANAMGACRGQERVRAAHRKERIPLSSCVAVCCIAGHCIAHCRERFASQMRQCNALKTQCNQQMQGAHCIAHAGAHCIEWMQCVCCICLRRCSACSHSICSWHWVWSNEHLRIAQGERWGAGVETHFQEI